MRYAKTLLIAVTLAAQLPAMGATTPVKLYKNPNCFCCNLYGKHLEENGFKVEIINTTDMATIKQTYGIPEKLEGCHTAIVEGYVVEGLVPAQFIKQVLKEHRPIKGLALPGMPVGAPGMPGQKARPLNIYTLDSSSSHEVFASF